MAGTIIVILLIGAVVALVVYLATTAINQRNVAISFSEQLPWPPEESVQRLQAMATPMLQRWRYRVTNQGVGNVQFSYTYRPAWLVIPCVLFFPIGLLSLIYRKTVDLTVNGFPSGGGAQVSVIGTGTPDVRERFGAMLKDLALHGEAASQAQP